jgi:hypothetical protein
MAVVTAIGIIETGAIQGRLRTFFTARNAKMIINKGIKMPLIIDE